MEKSKLLELRKVMKARKPDFVRQDIHKKKGLKRKWRKPKGLQSKLRLKKRGKGKPVSKGYRSPSMVRGLHKSGLELRRIFSTKDLEGISPKTHCVLISSTVGARKKLEILKLAKEKEFYITNVDADKFTKTVTDAIALKKKSKEDKKKKEPSKKEEIKKEEIKKEPAKVSSEEEATDKEKQEKDKLLTKRER